MMRVAHVSDPHFGTEEPQICRALREDLLALRPDLVVLTGDVTQRARLRQFLAARIFLDSLAPIPVLALPGNHDLPLFDLLTRFSSPYKYFRRHIGAELAPAWQGPELAVLGVNSTRVLRHKHGALLPATVSEVAERLRRLRQTFKLVALHHPLAVVEDGDLRNRPRGGEAALAAWIGAGADLFLGGHIHLPYCVLAESAGRRAVVMQAGTAVSWRRRAGQANSYNLVELRAEDGTRRMRIEQRDFDAGRACFAPRLVWSADDEGEGWTLAVASPAL